MLALLTVPMSLTWREARQERLLLTRARKVTLFLPDQQTVYWLSEPGCCLAGRDMSSDEPDRTEAQRNEGIKFLVIGRNQFRIQTLG